MQCKQAITDSLVKGGAARLDVYVVIGFLIRIRSTEYVCAIRCNIDE